MKYLTGLLLPLLATLVFSSSAYALKVDETCTPVDVVFARGSGQGLGQGEFTRFSTQLSKRLGAASTPHTYELGYESYGGYNYGATDVDNIWNGNALGAATSAGYGHDYGKSVDAGVGELYSYITQRHAKCGGTGTRYVLSGYSQGAQVIGQTLPKFSQEIRDKIIFSALFGDPKLHLPEGEGLYPAACRGKNFSSWRRVIGDCHADGGSLKPRKPYLPADLSTKTGLWCLAQDFVCGTSKLPYDTAGHSRYANINGAIDGAAIEIAKKIKATLPADKAPQVDTSRPRGAGTTGVDVVYVIDTTGSMGYQIQQAKAFARQSAEQVKAMNGRVALVAYRDAGDSYTARIMSGFQEDQSEFLAQLDALTVDGGGDWYEATLHALMTAFNGLSWKNGATKAAVVLTDAPFHNPDMVDGTTIDMVAKRSLEIDPVNVYPVVSADIASYYQELATKTTGQVIADTGDTAAALTTALTKIQERPTPLLKNLAYSAEPGQEITFDASDSYVVDAAITKYEWDFNGDGTFERTTAEPVTDYTYPTTFTGTMQVRVSADNGTIANASATVDVSVKTPPALPAAPKNLKATITATTDMKSTVTLSWEPTDNLAQSWLLRMDDFPLGTMTPDRRSIEITDVDRAADVTFSLVGLTADFSEGSAATTIVTKYTNTPPTTTCSTTNPLTSYICLAYLQTQQYITRSYQSALSLLWW